MIHRSSLSFCIRAWDSSLWCAWINSRCPLFIFVTSCVSSPHVAKPGAHLTIWFQSFRTMTQTHISTLNEHIGPCCIIGAWNMANKGTIYQFVHQNMIQILSCDEHQTDCNECSCGNQHHKKHGSISSAADMCSSQSPHERELS